MPSNGTRTQRTEGGTATSRLGQARPATRRPVKARLALSGPAGAGKTWTALAIADAICPGGTKLVLDTEANEPDGTAAELYADVYDFTVVPWAPPYDPRDLAATIIDAGRHYDVVIVDSGTHFWRGEGGTLDIADGRFGGWKTATPAQNDLIEAVQRCEAHVIMCMRAKEQYLVTENNGRQDVQKVGLGAIQRDDLEYEFQVVGMLNMEHRLDIGKTRCAAVAGRSYQPNHEHEFAAVYAEWLASGTDLARMADVEAVRMAVRAIEEPEARKTAAAGLRDTFGLTDYLTKAQLPDVWAWLAAQRNIEEHPFARPADADPDAAPICGTCGTTVLAGWHRTDANAPAQAPQATPAVPESAEAPVTPEPAPEAATGPLSPACARCGHPEAGHTAAGSACYADECRCDAFVVAVGPDAEDAAWRAEAAAADAEQPAPRARTRR